MFRIFRKKKSTKRSQAGFSIMELMISLAIFLIALSAVFALNRFGLLMRNSISMRTDQLRTTRIALEYIRRDAVNAGNGFHRTGGNAPDGFANTLFQMTNDSADTQRDFFTSVMGGNNVNTNALNAAQNTDTLVFAARDLSFNGGNKVDYNSAAVSGTSINISTNAGIAAACNPYDLYLFEAQWGTTQVMGMATSVSGGNTITLAPGDPLGINQSASATGNAQSMFVVNNGGGSIKRVNLVSYSVTNNGVLVRRTYGNKTGQPAASQIETRELAWGVTAFQVRYFLENGTLVDDPSNGNNGRTNQLEMNKVVQIQVTMTIRPENDSGMPASDEPLTMVEYISTKNLRYEAS